MPKATSPGNRPRRHNPLDEDLLARGLLRQKAPKRKNKSGHEDEDEDGPGYVDSEASKRILQLSRELAAEDDEKAAAEKKLQKQQQLVFGLGSRFGGGADSKDEDEDEDEDLWLDDEDGVAGGAGADVDVVASAEYSKYLPSEKHDDDPILQGLKLRMDDSREEKLHMDDSREEETTAERHAKGAAGAPGAAGGRNLADIIMAKISEFEAGERRRAGGDDEEDEEDGDDGFFHDDVDMDPRVVDVYVQCGSLLSRYKSGKLPKPLKILPTVPEWETLIEMAQPQEWTANACYEMTKIFISAKADVGRRFLELVMLERVRHDIRETKSLNVHLFAALKKALFRPAAFFKGFLYPLVLSGTATLREAQIVSAALVRTSIPVLHSSAALKGLCDIAAQISPDADGQSAISVFIKALLDKRYALPNQVVDTLVIHFLQARNAAAALPVIWHQSFLVFAQRYHDSFTEDQREELLNLLLSHGHPAIGPEIRRELLAGRDRGVPLRPQGADLDGDDTMLIDA